MMFFIGSPDLFLKRKRGPLPLGKGPRGSGGDLLSRARRPGTISERRLDFRVRNGNGYDPASRTAEIFKNLTDGKRTTPRKDYIACFARTFRAAGSGRSRGGPRSLKKKKKASRTISIARLSASPRSHLRPINVVVSDGPSGGCPRET